MHRTGFTLPSRRLVSQEDQSLIERPDVPRSRFTGRWGRIMPFDAGLLVPFLIDEILPGDHMRYNVTAYVRTQTFLFPSYRRCCLRRIPLGVRLFGVL